MNAARLSWNDLLIEKPKHDPEQLLEDWRWLLGGPFQPIVWSKFGDCFVERQTGAVDLLDILGGSLRKVADSPEHFQKLLNQRGNQGEWLLSELIWDLHQRGTIPKEGECYALKIHPAMGGKLEIENIIVMSHLIWSSMSGQLYRQLSTMPPGSVITEFKE